MRSGDVIDDGPGVQPLFIWPNACGAAALHRDDRQIRQEERDMAGQDGSHITRREDYALNQQENHLSRQIGQ